MHKIDIDLFETIESSKWSDKRKRSIDCNNPKGFSEKQYCKRQKRGGAYKSEALTKKQKEKLVELEKEVPMTDFIKKYGEKEGRAIYFATLTKMAKAADNRIPEKRKDGSKRPKSKHSDLYTDENPEGTIKGLGFKDPESARKSVNIIEKSKKTHKHKVQATMAMEQRSRFAAKNAKDSKTKKRLLAANKIYKAYLEKLKKRTKVSVSSIVDNKINIDFSEEIKSHDLFCDCEDGNEEFISEQSWASEKNKGKKLNKPFRTPGGPKKFSVYVKNEKGNVVKVNFGDPNMEIKRDDPNRRKNFRARHNCDNPGPKTKARYWSCRQWRAGTKVEGSEEEQENQILEMLDESESSRPGAKSAAQTPSKPHERKKGSSKNPPGSAGTKPTAKKDAEKILKRKDKKSMISKAKITFSEQVTKALQNKVAKHNKKYPSKKVTLGQLKKVYRRGAGAFSTSHRPGMTRGGWAMARVNMYLKMRRGGKVKDSYRKADSDVARASYTYLENDGDFGIGMEEEIEVNMDLKEYGLTEEQDEFFENIFAEHEESHEEDHEKSMATTQLTKISQQASAIKLKLSSTPGEMNLEGWVQDKISKTEHNMSAVYDYMMYSSNASHDMSKYSFNNPGEAMQMAKKMGLSGIHTHGEGDDTVFMPGKNHEDLMKKLDHPEESDAGHSPSHKKGLWENIRDKKRRMGKNYRPAKPGDKDRPTKEALERAKGELTEKQKKLPPALQKAILKKAGKKPAEDSTEKKDDKDEKESKESTKGLTEKQKKLPPALQKAIMKKKKK